MNDKNEEFKSGDIVVCLSESSNWSTWQLGVLVEMFMFNAYLSTPLEHCVEPERMWRMMTPDDGLVKRSERGLRHIRRWEGVF